MKIEAVEAIPLQMNLLDDVAPHQLRAQSHNDRATLYSVALDDGTVGWGDAMGEPEDVSAFVGQDAVAGLRQVRHGGVQMALYDAVGRALEVPANALMGRQVRTRVPFAYWSIDLPPEVWAKQVEHAASLGHTTYKFKCRPWWDPLEQVEAAAKAAPEGFRFWLDFNGHLRETRLALPILQALERFECVGGFESPIPQREADGYAELRRKIDKPIAAHFGAGCCHVTSVPNWDRGTPGLDQISRRLCDGFVLGGSDWVTVQEHASVAAEARVPFWIQTVGTALRAAWLAHAASTCAQATLAHLAAHDLWADDVAEAPRPEAGWVTVPDGPGLGIAVDEEAVERLKQESASPPVKRISTVVMPDGRRWHFANEPQRHEAFYFGDIPGFVPGVRLEVREDDGSNDFKDLYKRCESAPVYETGERKAKRLGFG